MKKEDKVVKLWRRKFREYVKTHGGLKLQDGKGNVIAFHQDKPMWSEDEVVSEADGSIFVTVDMDETAYLNSALCIERWLREFAASMGRFCVDVSTHRIRGRVAVSIDFPKKLSKQGEASERFEKSGEKVFWIVGDPTIRQFMALGGREYHGLDCETTDDPLAADQYETSKDAVDALCADEEVILWAGATPFPSRVRPLMVDVKVTLKSKG